MGGMITTTDRCIEQQLDEIDGYLDLGMQEEALRLIAVTLAKRPLSAEEFNTCVYALMQVHQPEQWKACVERAYRNLNRPNDDMVRSAMLNFYFSIRDPEKAFEIFPTHWTKFFDAWTMMQVCLALSRLEEAKSVARVCTKILAHAKDDFTKASMADALAGYYLEIGDCPSALRMWENAPPEVVFQRQRLCGMVKARLLQALQASRAGLEALDEAAQKVDFSTELRLPGNRSTLITDAETELKELESAIERLVL